MGTPVGGVWIRQSVPVAPTGAAAQVTSGDTMRASLTTVPTSSARSRTPEFYGETAQVDAARRQSAGVPVALTLCSANPLTVAHGAGTLPEHGVCRLPTAPNHFQGRWPASSGPRPPCRPSGGCAPLTVTEPPTQLSARLSPPGERIGTTGIRSQRLCRVVSGSTNLPPRHPGQGPG